MVSILSGVNYKSIYVGLMFFGVTLLSYFFISNIIRRGKNNVVSYEIYNIVDNIILQLGSNVSLADTLVSTLDIINDKDTKLAFERLIYDYELYNLNIHKAAVNFEKKFTNYDVTAFSEILKQYGQNISIIESLENFSNILRKKYINYLGNQTKVKVIYVSIGVVIALLNLIIIVLYPIFIDISTNLTQIFS